MGMWDGNIFKRFKKGYNLLKKGHEIFDTEDSNTFLVGPSLNEREKFHGEYILYDTKSGKMINKSNYKNDKLDGKFIDYDKNEKIINEYTYKNDKVWNGLFIDKNNEGLISTKTTFKNGKCVEHIQYEYSESGKLQEKLIFKGKKHIKSIWYNEVGDLIGEGTFKNNKEWNGIFIGFHENGEIGEKISYKDGLKDGRWITYYDDGYVYMVRYNKDGKYFGYTYYDDEIPEDWDLPDDYEEEDIDLTYGNELMMVRFSNDGQYEYGRKHGEWVYYSIPTNEVKSRGVYKYGKFDGKWIWNYDNSNLIQREGKYKDGLEDGEFNEYKPDGSVYLKEIYKNGELVDSNVLDSDFYNKTQEGHDELYKYLYSNNLIS